MQDLLSLTVLMCLAGGVPLLVGLLRIPIGEVVLLLVGGVIVGPALLGWLTISDGITLLSELGLGLLFFLAGMHIDHTVLRGQIGRRAALGWLGSAALAGVIVTALAASGMIVDAIGVGLALTTTALGTLLPLLRDSGALESPLGRIFTAVGAWGEIGPILGIAILLGSKSVLAGVLSLVFFAFVVLAVSVVPRFAGRSCVVTLISEGYQRTSQMGVRLALLLIVALLTVASGLGLDLVLGAFAAGLIVGRFVQGEQERPLMLRIESLAFGFFIPIFFVVSGAKLDLAAVLQQPARLAIYLTLFLVVRGVPQFLIFRGVLPSGRDRSRLALYAATTLPLLVAITTVEVEAGAMMADNAAALVGAGVLSVLIFPFIASRIPAARRSAAFPDGQ
ncbi:MAG: cation:proton antiporter [Actinomycetales bacterium]